MTNDVIHNNLDHAPSVHQNNMHAKLEQDELGGVRNTVGLFISYSREQFYFAESLSLHLQNNGITTWLDVQRLAPGANWA